MQQDREAPPDAEARLTPDDTPPGAELASAAARLDTLELVAFHLGVAEQRLAEIRGRSTLGPVAEDLLARIFARFCIGK